MGALAGAAVVTAALLVLSTLQRQRFAALGFALPEEHLALWFARVPHAPGRLLYLMGALVLSFRLADALVGSSPVFRLTAPLRVLGSRPLLVYGCHFVPFGLLSMSGWGNGESPLGEVALGAEVAGCWHVARQGRGVGDKGQASCSPPSETFGKRPNP